MSALVPHKSATYAMALLFAAALLGLAAPTLAQPGVPGTRIHGDVMAGYYATSDVYRYVADVNVWFDFGSYKTGKFYFLGGILTQIKTRAGDKFQPDRYIGTLEPGIRWDREKASYSFFIKHQSLHDIDRFDGVDESYEIYGLRYYRANPWNFTISAGNYLNKSEVDYDWDFFASVDNGCVTQCYGKNVYGAALAHYVTEEGNLTDRDGFLDYKLEVGIETSANVRYFLAYRQVHDIDRFGGITDHNLAIGTRYTW